MTERDAPQASESPSWQQLSWYLRFPKQTEQRFRQYFIAHSVQVVRLTLPLVTVFYAVAVWLEYSHLSEMVTQHWLPHLVIFVILLVMQAVVWKAPQWLQPCVAIGLLGISICADRLALTTSSEFSHFYFLLCGVMILLTPLLRILLAWALPVILLIMMGVAISLYEGDFPLGVVQLRLMLITLMAFISVPSLYLTERLLRQRFLIEEWLQQKRHELSAANQVLTHESREDTLTRVLNRRGMEQSLNGLLGRMNQREASAPEVMSLLLFDIDFFKQFNDNYGHLEGDACLQQVAGVARRLMTGVSGFVARYGGEEFVLVLVGQAQDAAVAFAEKLRAEVQRIGVPHKGSKVAEVVTISVGVSAYVKPINESAQVMDAASLIQLADQALYEAKHQGRNRVCMPAC